VMWKYPAKAGSIIATHIRHIRRTVAPTCILVDMRSPNAAHEQPRFTALAHGVSASMQSIDLVRQGIVNGRLNCNLRASARA
jgi:hypothetical protein